MNEQEIYVSENNPLQSSLSHCFFYTLVPPVKLFRKTQRDSGETTEKLFSFFLFFSNFDFSFIYSFTADKLILLFSKEVLVQQDAVSSSFWVQAVAVEVTFGADNQYV